MLDSLTVVCDHTVGLISSVGFKDYPTVTVLTCLVLASMAFLALLKRVFAARNPTLAARPALPPVATASRRSRHIPLAFTHDASEPVEQIPGLASVNYHFTRKCNLACHFCFHTDKHAITASDIDDRARDAIELLYRHGMRKINFSGGEPFLNAKWLGEMVQFCKTLQPHPLAVSIVSNGTRIKEEWIEKYGQYVDYLAISCDSFDDDTLARIGRREKQKSHSDQVAVIYRVSEWCREANVAFKINSVICADNWCEDMREHILTLAPKRWKVFQVLEIEGENKGPDAKRNAAALTITAEQFEAFRRRHADIPSLVPESNDDMRNSYIILDEQLRFLDNRGQSKRPTECILDIGVPAAFADAGFDEQAFDRRGGRYEWHTQPTGQQGAVDIEELR